MSQSEIVEIAAALTEVVVVTPCVSRFVVFVPQMSWRRELIESGNRVRSGQDRSHE